MRLPLYVLSSAFAIFIIGCGSDSDTPAETRTSVLVSGSYAVNAVVSSGNVTANERYDLGAGWYQFDTEPRQTITVSYGVNDINPPNAKADDGEPYLPLLQAPSTYKNITPFTTMLMDIGPENMQSRYPNAYAYDMHFDFDVVTLSEHNLSIAKENAKAVLELSAANSPKKIINQRIINGNNVQAGDPTWESIVSLQYYKSHACGGTLIDEEWVLTAAHCLVDFNGNARTVLPTALADTYSLTIGGMFIEAEAIYVHPEFDLFALNNDIGLIHLKTPVTTVSPIALNHHMLEFNTMVKVAGWGNTRVDGNNYPNDLMQVTMPIIKFETCNASYQMLNGNMFCAGYMDGSKDSCQGDSGGPLIHFENGQYFLSGIVSFGGTETQFCGAPDYPGVYTKVSRYIDWIEGYTGSLERISDSSSSFSSVSTPSSSSTSSSSSSISSSFTTSSSSSFSSSSDMIASSSSSSSSQPSLSEIFIRIDEVQDLDELNQIIIDNMGYYNGVYPE